MRTTGRYALRNARNRVAPLEYERDHPDGFNHKHPAGALDRAIARARRARVVVQRVRAARTEAPESPSQRPNVRVADAQ